MSSRKEQVLEAHAGRFLHELEHNPVRIPGIDNSHSLGGPRLHGFYRTQRIEAPRPDCLNDPVQFPHLETQVHEAGITGSQARVILVLGTNEAEQLENVPRTAHESDIEFRIGYRSYSGNGFPGDPQQFRGDAPLQRE